MSRVTNRQIDQINRRNLRGSGGLVQHPVGERVNAITSWVRDMARGNGIEEDLKVVVRKRNNVDGLQEMKERVENKIEEDEWPDDAPQIEKICEHSTQFPFAPADQVVESQRAGLHVIHLSSGERVIQAVAPLSIDSDDVLSVLVVWAGTEDAIGDFGTIKDGVQVGAELDPGVYSAHITLGRLALSEDVDLSETPIIHPKAEEFFSSVEQFFDDPSPYTRFEQPGLKTWLLYGTYGTGKSTMVEALARRMQDRCAVVFASGSKKLQVVAEIAADQNAPTILVASEAETILNDSDGQAPSKDAGTVGASSEMLNFLDGVDQPRNTAGTGLVLTTNRPKRISNRILKRTGRINRRLEIGPLEGEHAVECAEFYLPDDADVSQSVIEEVSGGRVGDDIKSVVESAIRIAIEEKEPINDEIYRQAGEEMEQEMQKIEDFDGMDDESHEYGEEGESGVGFNA